MTVLAFLCVLDPFFFCAVPLLFLYVRAILSGEALGLKDAWHFAPALGVALYLYPWYAQSHDAKLLALLQERRMLTPWFYIKSIGLLVQGVLYIAAIVWMVYRQAKAQYSMAIDRNAFLRPETQALAFTGMSPAVPYGLGWFVQTIGGVKVVCHYGLWTSNSSLIIKVPSKGLTFVALANSDTLTSTVNLGNGDLMVSPVAREFVNGFVTGNARLP